MPVEAPSGHLLGGPDARTEERRNGLDNCILSGPFLIVISQDRMLPLEARSWPTHSQERNMPCEACPRYAQRDRIF